MGRALECGLGRAYVVGVAGDAPLVEDDEQVGVDRVRRRGDLPGEARQRDIGESPVGVVEQVDPADAQDGRRLSELFATDLSEGAIRSAEGGGLTVGEAQHRHRGTRVGKAREDGPEAEALVIGVGAHREDR